MPGKKSQTNLGKSIIRSRFRGGPRPRDDDTTLHTTDIDSTPKWVKMQSITQENDLDAFLRNAELAGTEFTAEKLNVQVIVDDNTHNPYLLSADKERQMLEMMNQNKDKLTVPRRPQWTASTTAEELHSLEKESFLEWRRRLAVLEEEMQMVVTPFERNIEVWRQLWRVLERSDVVVQIVDARNPLFFYSEDLYKYVQEIDPAKERLLLINKADFLTESQRKQWADYFDSRGVRCVFFSAAEAMHDLEQQNAEMHAVVEEETTLIAQMKDQSIGTGSKRLQVLSCAELYDLFASFHKAYTGDEECNENKAGITVGLVGYPNVGKSSTINALVGEKKVTVSATPGKTKHFQTIVLSDSVTLCDCPGLVFPMFATTKAEMVCNGVLPIDQLREYSGPATLVAQRIPRVYLEWRYGVSLPKPDEGEMADRAPTSSELLCAYAAMRGFRKAGQGNPDESRAARVILKDYVKGDLLFCHAPPGIDEKTFNGENYRAGGLKFTEAEIAKDVVANREAKQILNPNLSQTSVVTSAPSGRLDKEFFHAENSGTAHTVGKNASSDFHRVDTFPHQSGFILGNVRSASASSLSDLRDKKHKSAKRGKDRSWSWQPQPQGLQQILEVLRHANSPDNRIHQMVQQKLNEFDQIPDYSNYLLYVLTEMKTEPETVRAMAGLLLKNNIRRLETMEPAILDYIKSRCLNSISDPLSLVRSTVGIVITTILPRITPIKWPELLPTLVKLLDSPDNDAVEGSFGALHKICEDSVNLITQSVPIDSLKFMIQKFLEKSESQNPKIRVLALSSVNCFIVAKSPALFPELIGPLIVTLSRRCTDQVSDVRKLVCQAFVYLVEAAPEELIKHLNDIVNFMISATRDAESNVALEACEFWVAFAEHEALQESLGAYLPSLIPLLLEKMAYSEDELLMLETEEDESVPDREQDVKPLHYKAKTHTAETGGGEENEVDEDEDEDDDDDDDVYGEWTLRKCAAASLDVISNTFGNDILAYLLPALNKNLSSPEWKYQESSILAMGAIAEGCIAGMEPHLHQLIPFLFQALRSPKYLVRSITCWTLGRYCRWCLYPTDGTRDPAVYLQPLLAGLLGAMLDRNKKVQESACSAMATLEEQANGELIPYLDQILPTFVAAFSKYQSKNLYILYDAMGTLAETSGSNLNQKKYIDLIMPILLSKWNTLADTDVNLFPLLECLSFVAAALGSGFIPFAALVYERSIRLIHTTLAAQVAFDQEPQRFDPPEKDFIVVSLDLLSGLFQGIGTSAESLITSVQPNLVDLLQFCIKDPVPDVRQSAFALIGDLAAMCFLHLQPCIPTFMPVIIEQLDHALDIELAAVCNNACWASGEIAIKMGPGFTPFAQPLISRLIPILNHPEMARSLRENSAISLGRIGINLPDVLAPELANFAENWCKAVRHTRDNQEKESAFRGFCEVVQRNPNAMGKSFPMFCDAMANCQRISPQLVETFKVILAGFKQMMGAKWPEYFGTFPQSLRKRLTDKYGLS